MLLPLSFGYPLLDRFNISVECRGDGLYWFPFGLELPRLLHAPPIVPEFARIRAEHPPGRPAVILRGNLNPLPAFIARPMFLVARDGVRELKPHRAQQIARDD
jgi:hypothetical protein